MFDSPRSLALTAAAGSAALLLAAFGFQAAGYAPCELCILQRWPHAAGVVIGAAIALTGHRRLWSVLGLVAAVSASVLAAYHTGVELGWWAGPAACTGGMQDLAMISPADLMKRIEAAQPIRCDQPAWMFLGLSMAAWNAVASAVLAGVWAASLRRPR